MHANQTSSANRVEISIDQSHAAPIARRRMRRKEGRDQVFLASVCWLIGWVFAVIPVFWLMTEPVILFLVGKALFSRSRPGIVGMSIGLILALISGARLIVATMVVVSWLG